MSTYEEDSKAFAAVVARSWDDAEFRAALLADPAATLAANGVSVPAGKNVVLIEGSESELHLVLPPRPSELSDEELDSVAGGWFTYPCHDLAPKG